MRQESRWADRFVTQQKARSFLSEIFQKCLTQQPSFLLNAGGHQEDLLLGKMIHSFKTNANLKKVLDDLKIEKMVKLLK